CVEGRLGVGAELREGDAEPHDAPDATELRGVSGPRDGEQPVPGGWGARGPVLFCLYNGRAPRFSRIASAGIWASSSAPREPAPMAPARGPRAAATTGIGGRPARP